MTDTSGIQRIPLTPYDQTWARCPRCTLPIRQARAYGSGRTRGLYCSYACIMLAMTQPVLRVVQPYLPGEHRAVSDG